MGAAKPERVVVKVRARDLTAQMLGHTVAVCRPRGCRTVFAASLMRGELLELVHHIDRNKCARTAHGIVLTLAVGPYDAEVTFAVRPQDLIVLYPPRR